jgi:hypothetical protein
MVLRVWASTGFHPASPGPVLAQATHSITGLHLRTLLTIDVGELVAASLGRSTVRRQSSGLKSTMGKSLGKDRL